MKKKVFTIILALSIIVIIFIVICNCKNNIPNEITNFMEEYMNACKIEMAKSVNYCYFKTEEERLAYVNSNNLLIGYKIESSKKINDNLYQFTNLVETKNRSGHYIRVYNFVARIDGKLFFIANVMNVPDEIRENLDVNLYSYK